MTSRFCGGMNTAVNIRTEIRHFYENRVNILKSAEDFGFNNVFLYFRLQLHMRNATVQQANPTSDLSTLNRILIYFMYVLGSHWLFTLIQ